MNTANKITILRILLIPVFMLVLMLQFKYSDLAASLIFAVAAATDGVDGYVARKYNQVTDFGKFIDPLADKLLVATALICLVDMGRIASYMAVIIIAREFIVTSLRIVAISKGVVIAAEMTGKIKTVIQIIATVCALLFYEEKFMILNWSAGYIAMFIATLFTIYSGFVYLKKNWQLISESK
ncbi:MAG: CDP-diacylglycerol--glycerol-3-phosphate 3-phosphatidyltransferase [Ruminococcaceae bacterium]|nr:CDP-diacylglycerol--glycerol-3-phosphate 3-phosphatidyltransferase [Oscillospiraceae bacterium]